MKDEWDFAVPMNLRHLKGCSRRSTKQPRCQRRDDGRTWRYPLDLIVIVRECLPKRTAAGDEREQMVSWREGHRMRNVPWQPPYSEPGMRKRG